MQLTKTDPNVANINAIDNILNGTAAFKYSPPDNSKIISSLIEINPIKAGIDSNTTALSVCLYNKDTSLLSSDPNIEEALGITTVVTEFIIVLTIKYILVATVYIPTA